MSLVILKSEYLKVIQTHSQLIAELPKAVQFCAAKLIQYFQHWSSWKQNVHRTSWIYMPCKKIHADLMGEHSLHVIRAAIALLVKLGILKRRHNPNGQDKTWQYQLKSDVLSGLLNIDACRAEPDSAITDSEHGTFKAEQAENNVEQQTQEQYTDIKATTTNVSIDETNAQLEESKTSISSSNVSKLTQNSKKLLTPKVNKKAAIIAPPSTPPTTDTPPTPSELSEVKRQLRELRVNPDSCRSVIVNYWANVRDAIAYLKTATWANTPIAVFIDACKKGLKPEEEEEFAPGSRSVPEETRPPTPSQLQLLDEAKNSKKIHDYFFSGDGITKVVLHGGFQMPWWEFLGIVPCLTMS